MAGGGIEVDGRELSKFAGSVEASTTGTFVPTVQSLFRVYAQGTAFGSFTASAEVYAARVKHHDAMVSMTQSMAGFIEASRVLVDAVTEVRSRYVGADGLGAARAADVDAILRDAVVHAKQITGDAPTIGPTELGGGT